MLIHDRALLITFYRPFITKAPEGLPAAQQQAWQSQIRNKMDTAALQTNSIVDNLAREKLLEFGGPMTCVPSPLFLLLMKFPLIAIDLHCSYQLCKCTFSTASRLMILFGGWASTSWSCV